MWVIVKDKLFNLTRVRIIEKVDKHKDMLDRDWETLWLCTTTLF